MCGYADCEKMIELIQFNYKSYAIQKEIKQYRSVS